MYAPHTVTLYNIITNTDAGTFSTSESVYVTVLRGVMLQASKGANVRKSGLEGADAANLYIPFSVKAVDGITGAEKSYIGPKEFFRASDRTALWTLSYDGNGGQTFFIKGEFITDKASVAISQDNCYSVTKVDTKDYGSPDMQHWEVGGV